MYPKKYFLLFYLSLVVFGCFAQPAAPPVNISMEQNDRGDSLWFTVSINSYTKPSSLMLTATLEDPLRRDTFFLPVIDSVLQYCFVYPASIRKDLLLKVYFFPGIFKVSGILNEHGKLPAIKAILLTENKQLFSREISFKNDNHFTLPALVFEKEATLAFNYANNMSWQTHPDVTISISPAAKDFTELIFSAEIKHTGIQEPLHSDDHNNQKDSLEKEKQKKDEYKNLKEVKIDGAKKSNIVKFNEEYSSGIFRGGFERIIDCIDNNNILSYRNCIAYLQAQVPGISFSTELFGHVVLRMRQQEVMAFYIDEIPVDIEQLMGVSTSEIAMLKVYQAPFFGSSKGGGGAIALYTRRGKYNRSAGSDWLFAIKGYAPQVNVLFEDK